MKKILFVLLVGFFACSKEKEGAVCYYCTFSLQANGTPPPPKTVCITEGEDINNYQFTDDKGNRAIPYCTRQ